MAYWQVAALEVKRSKGISRGKCDKTDAKDIAYYAITHLHDLKLSKIPEADIIELRLLLAEREKLVKAIGMFTTTKENKDFLPKEVLKPLLQHSDKTVSLLKKQLASIEKLIEEIINKKGF